MAGYEEDRVTGRQAWLLVTLAEGEWGDRRG
jgi:hypothetical protein